MDGNTPENRGTLTLKDVAKEVYPELDEITAYRKTLKNFKSACNQMGIDLEQFKPGRDYKIPIGSKSMWMLLIRNTNVLEGNPSQKQYVNFVEELKETKEYLDEEHADIENDMVDSLDHSETMSSVYEMFYTPSSHGKSMVMLFQNEILQEIQNDFDFIMKNAAEDRLVFQAENFYYKPILDAIRKNGKFVKRIIKEKWHEK